MVMAKFQSTLDHLFPPPTYLAMPAVGVDVSDTSLKYIRFDKHRDGVALGAWGDLKIPDGVIS
ncbi:MAG: hypothetical protein RLZZ234_521, partial [Candidatus Parcubacteria bacterium]